MSLYRNITTSCLVLALSGALVFSPVRLWADTPPAPVLVGTVAFPSVTPGSPEEIKLLLRTAPNAADYPNASSAFLLDLMDIEVKPNGAVRSVTRVTRKIFNKRGRDEEAEVKIGYNSTYETIRIRRARTIRPDGTVVEVRPEEIRDSRPSDYEDFAIRSFSLPAVDDDCIIDYEYETIRNNSIMPGHFWQPWYFQSSFNPVVKTRLSVTVPKTLTLHQRLANATVQPVVREVNNGKSKQFIWEDNNLPALETEPMMPPLERLYPKLDLSTLPDWQALASWYHSLAKDRMVADPQVKAKTRELIAGKTTPEEKAKAIYHYVEEKTRYVSIALGQSAYQPRPAARTLADQFGDCKDMTTLMVAMLREAGITAYPALLAMDSKDRRSELLPSPSAMNHAVCLAEINGKKYWLDGTAVACPFGSIPMVDRGCEALVVREDGKGVWETIPLGDPEEIRAERTVALTLSPDGSAKGTITILNRGDGDIELRTLLRDFPKDKQRLIMEDYARQFGANPKVTSFQVSDYRDMDRPTRIEMNVMFPSYANQSGDLLLFRARPDQTGGSVSSPFTEDFRRTPVVQTTPGAATATLELTLPDGYSPIALPRPANIRSDLGRYERDVTRDGKILRVVIRGENYAAEVPPGRYADVRKYYDAYMKTADEFIVLKKD
ncbi:MAG: DUF3857 and transglutaminase domain-containing protein [Capsulimonadales bacterium]|nr:DUF3857 and transglutaminase domain-containing protein [Capsulimonadales bacterium]